MKKLLLAFSIVGLATTVSLFSQTLIIEENFQEWDETEGVYNILDSCGTYPRSEYMTERYMDILTTSGTEEIGVDLTMVVIKPLCPSRRGYDGGTMTEGLSTGWVQLNKVGDEFNTMDDWEDSYDTIGEFIFGPVPQIDSIRVGHSATGSNRGFRIYLSDDGEDWFRPTEDEFWDGDSQGGAIHTVEIFESDIYVKLTSGFKESDQTNQYTRIHDLWVWGEPGELEIIEDINKTRLTETKITPMGNNTYQLDQDLVYAKAYTVLGRETNIESFDQMIDLNSLTTGVYMVQAWDKAGESYMYKVLKD